MSKPVAVVIGVGGMGEAVARRQGCGCKLVLADFDSQTLDTLASRLTGDGYDVTAQHVDVGSRESVESLAKAAASAGPVTEVVHTAGLSPVQASAEDIFRVDLYGVALTLEAFGEVVEPNSAGVVIASMSGHMVPDLPEDQRKALATAPSDQLLELPFVQNVTHSGFAYAMAKQANRFRVQAESLRWGRRGARLNSVSPGIISTPQGRLELDSEHGSHMRGWIDASGTHRIGTPGDIANAVAFLLSSQASFVTGTDLLVDGGVVGAIRTGGPDRSD